MHQAPRVDDEIVRDQLEIVDRESRRVRLAKLAHGRAVGDDDEPAHAPLHDRAVVLDADVEAFDIARDVREPVSYRARERRRHRRRARVDARCHVARSHRRS